MKRLQINNIDLEYVDRFKYLGVTLDRRLNFRLHYSDVMSKLHHKIHLFCKIRRMINIFAALTIYKSHILSFLEYGSIFLDCLPQNYKCKLQRLQNKCLRVVYHADRHTSNYELHQRSKMLPLEVRRRMGICNLMFKRICIDPNIVLIPGRSGTRSQSYVNLRLLNPKNETFKRSITYSGPLLWNKLPNYIKSSNNLAEFKRKHKRYLSDNFCQDGFV